MRDAIRESSEDNSSRRGSSLLQGGRVHGIKERQKQFNQSIMKQEVKKLRKFQRNSIIDFSNETFDHNDIVDMLQKIAEENQP